MWRFGILLILSLQVQGKLESEEDTAESAGERDLGGDYNTTRNYTQTIDDIDDSEERIGAAVTQIFRHPYAATLLKYDNYVCSGIILNPHWLLTLSKCFDPEVISSYVTHRFLGNYTIRTGSSYNNKGETISRIKMLINNFDLKVSAVKLVEQLEFGPRAFSVRLPNPDDDVTLGSLSAMLAWTPTGVIDYGPVTGSMIKHMRVVNAPVIDPSICEPSTKLLPGRYVCVGGVQDPNRHFCRKDNGGAVIQNNTLIAITSFLHTCALYTKTHAFPKLSSFSRWLDSVIWDENNRPTTTVSTTSVSTTEAIQNITEPSEKNIYIDPRKFMLTLPFDPINVPLEPAEDNSVIPRMSLYESYLQNIARLKTSTTADPNKIEQEKKEWLQKFGKSMFMMPPQIISKKYDQNDYN